jgi:hypothetical protein
MFQWLTRWKKKVQGFAKTASERIGYVPFKETVLERRVPKRPGTRGRRDPDDVVHGPGGHRRHHDTLLHQRRGARL